MKTTTSSNSSTTVSRRGWSFGSEVSIGWTLILANAARATAQRASGQGKLTQHRISQPPTYEAR